MQAKPLIRLDDVLLRHCTSATVLTANERLRLALIDAYERHHADLGMDPGPSPRISTMTAYLRHRFDALRQTGTTDRELLSIDAQRLVWLERSPQVPQVDADALYQRIAEAWRLIHDWTLEGALGQFSDNENHRLFRAWAENYQKGARVRGWVTEAELPALLADAIQTGALPADPLVLLGFDVVPPSLQRLIDAHVRVGAAVHMHAANRQQTRHTASTSAEDAASELRAAIHWAHEIAANANEPVAVGIAVPNLTESHDRIVCELDATMRPDDVDADPATSPYNVSGGIALGTVPVVADALDFVDWLIRPMRYLQVGSLLRSPFFDLGVSSARSQDSTLPESYDASQFAAHVAASPLREVVSKARRVGLVGLDATIIAVRDLLATAGWPKLGRLTSESFQAYQSLLSLLEELTASAKFVQPRDFGAAVRQIRRAADRRLFASERPKAPLQVLGYLETVGLEFTHLWVTGLNHIDWPSAPEPNPFIPLRLLRAARVARTDVEGQIAFARRMIDHWQHAAPTVVFSHSRIRDDMICRLSPLVSGLIDAPDEPDIDQATRAGHPYMTGRQSESLERRSEPDVGPVSVDRLRHRDSGVIRDQSACPFRAFARYRLHASQQRAPHSYPDATERGIAIHAALRETFDRLGPFIDLSRIDADTIDAAVNDAVSNAVATYRRLPDEFRSAERDRLKNLLLEWLRLEQTRPPFRVVATERATTLPLAGIEFQLRIDRIDEVGPRGGRLVIDYKTGAMSPQVVLGVRPEEPQLPMYALSVPDSVAIGFAQVRSGECRLNGWAGDLPAMRSPDVRFQPPPADVNGSWSDLQGAWRDRLTNLADDFHRGVVDVDPRDAKACRECDLHALCRVREDREYAPD